MAVSGTRIALVRDAFHLDVDEFLADSTGTALVGRNGAGKTTLLLALQGLIEHNGVVQRPSRCAGVFAAPAVLRGSVLWNIEIVVRSAFPASDDDARRRARAAAESVGLAALADRDARRLSSGERQRLALARALALEPQALFLDEAFANIDADGRVELRRLVRDFIERSGCTLVVATQTLADVSALCQRVVLLENGRVELDAPLSPATLDARPYLAALAAEATSP